MSIKVLSDSNESDGIFYNKKIYNNLKLSSHLQGLIGKRKQRGGIT